jgi:hypothetical protein
MTVPTWVVGEDWENQDAIDNHIVRLIAPHIVAKVTQKRGNKVMLTLSAGPPGYADQDALWSDPTWFELLQEGARCWAMFIRDPEYAKHPPEILVNPSFRPPKLLMCDNGESSRTFLVHTPPPFFAMEVIKRQWVPSAGDVDNPLVPIILSQTSPPPDIW